MQTITVEALKQRLEQNESIHLLDVREPSEYAETNMGALLLPLGQVMNGQIEPIEDWKEEEIVIHCRSGMRSMQACMMLEQMGFKHVVNLEGGILAWNSLNGG